jgi:hypothetical protein
MRSLTLAALVLTLAAYLRPVSDLSDGGGPSGRRSAGGRRRRGCRRGGCRRGRGEGRRRRRGSALRHRERDRGRHLRLTGSLAPDFLALLAAARPTRIKVTFAKVRVAQPNPRALVLVGHGYQDITVP